MAIEQRFTIISVDIYAEGVAEMRKAGGVPDFGQNLDYRIADYKSRGGGSELFGTWLDSVTGVANKEHSTMFRILPRASQLENIEPGFRESVIRADYAALWGGVELDSSDPRVKYNQHLTRAEVVEHPAWIAAAGGDRDKLKKYAYIWFGRTGRKKGMGFYVKRDTAQDELRELVLGNDVSSYAGGDGSFDLAHFALKK